MAGAPLPEDDQYDDEQLDEIGEDEEGGDDAALEPEFAPSDRDRAVQMGWKPRHQYRGPPENWSDYPEFLAKADEEMPVLRDQLRRTTDRMARQANEIEGLQRTLAEQSQAVKDAINLARRADERGYQRALRELKEQQRQAVAEGDTNAYDQIEEQIAAMETERAAEPEPAPVAAAPPPPAQAAGNPAVNDFVAANRSWFNDGARPYLRQAMAAFHGVVLAEGRITDVAQQLAEAKRRVASQYPDDAPDLGVTVRRAAPPPQRRAAPVLTPNGGGEAPRRRGSDPFEQIDEAERPDARKAFANARRFDESLTAAEYVALYINPHADALALRKNRN